MVDQKCDESEPLRDTVQSWVENKCVLECRAWSGCVLRAIYTARSGSGMQILIYIFD
jgi:hypothetical protein